jgi:HipA-like protein
MKMGELLGAIRDQFESWGIVLPRASSATAERGPRVYVLGPAKGSGSMRRIGTLWQQDGQFVFRYEQSFASAPDAEPILAFPDLKEEYRSRDLWPFFAVRIPPSERSDVREALAQHGLRPDQTLEVLGALAKRSVSNPYRLELAATQS